MFNGFKSKNQKSGCPSILEISNNSPNEKEDNKKTDNKTARNTEDNKDDNGKTDNKTAMDDSGNQNGKDKDHSTVERSQKISAR